MRSSISACFFVLVERYEPQAAEKFFGAAVLQKCCRGVGEQPTFAKQIILQQVLLAAIAFFETCQFAI